MYSGKGGDGEEDSDGGDSDCSGGGGDGDCARQIINFDLLVFPSL